jgi:hypothetical protein
MVVIFVYSMIVSELVEEKRKQLQLRVDQES